MANQSKARPVSYFNRDFSSFVKNLVSFSQAHHSGVLGDFNQASPTMAVLEFQAYVGDVLSYYQDFQFNEVIGGVLLKNAAALAKSRGYRPSGKRPARGIESFFVELPATTVAGNVVPDDTYAPILRAGTQVVSLDGNVFETVSDLPFSGSSQLEPRFVTGSQFDAVTGLPTYFAVRKDTEIVAGRTVTENFQLSDFKPFVEIELTQPDVIEVLSVVDSDGNEWVEVEHLAQDMVFSDIVNFDTDSQEVPYILKLVSVPRRFVSDYEPTTQKTTLVFGSGDSQNFDDELVPNLADLSLPLAGRRTFSSYNIDPQNFLKTRSLGLSPYNTNLTVRYRVGGGRETNVAPNTIRSVSNAVVDFTSNSLDVSRVGAVESSLECINLGPTDGGSPAESVAEIRVNSAAFFSAQNRVVTREDFVARIKSLPVKFGRPDKVSVPKNKFGSKSVNVHVLSKDSAGHMIRSSTNLKENIKTYLSKQKMLSDGIDILDGNIINLRVKFGVVVSSKFNRTETLTNCINAVVDYLDIEKQEMGQPIVISELEAIIQDIPGVVSIYELTFLSVFGNTSIPNSQQTLPYSEIRFDVSRNISNKILYCPADSIFEVKYPNVDIIGVSK